jgi:hypothetical protein
MLKAVAENLSVASQPLRFFGAELGCRMTCVRLSTGAVAVHSPIRATPELLASVADLGPVAWLIAPNAFHHLFVQEWRVRFPEATTLVAPRLLTKRRDLVGAVPLSAPPAAWGRDLEMVAMKGLPLMDEHVFFHRPSATLIVTDLAFRFGRDSPFFTRWLIRLGGRLGELSPTVVERLLIRDRAAFRESLKRVLEWPFDRVVMSHGQVLDSGGPNALARGYDWLLGR